MTVVGVSNIGLRRQRNEDRYLIDEERNLFAVCDGMGGHKGGDVASTLAVESLHASFSYKEAGEIPTVLLHAVERANQIIWEAGQRDPELHEMGTTLTAAVIDEQILYAVHVGDSSLFMIRANSIRKISADHTLAEQMCKDGLMRREELSSNPYNHVLTRALGVEPQVEVDFYSEALQAGDQILLCTDGLTDLVLENEILEILENDNDSEIILKSLVGLALDRGGHDNITIVLVSV